MKTHAPQPTAARGTPKQTFGGLAIFAASLLAAGGGALLFSDFANPLAANAASVLTAAVALALAVILLACLLPRRRNHIAPSRAVEKLQRERANPRESAGSARQT